MAAVNKVILIGNLGRDPEVRHSADGTAVCALSVATTFVTNKGGERREETEWHRVVLFNRLAEIAGEYLKKGRSIYVEGRIKTRKWADKETGQDRYSTEIIGEQLQMLGGKDDAGGAQSSRAQPTRPKTHQASAPSSPPSSLEDIDDQIPF